MRGPDLVPRRIRPAPVRDGLRPSRAEAQWVRRKRYQDKMKAAGKCVRCGNKRGPGGTTVMCNWCNGVHKFQSKERHARRVSAGLCGDCGAARGTEDTRTRCRRCADRNNAGSKVYRDRRKVEGGAS